MSSQAWHRLKPAATELPALHIKSVFTSTSYKICVTDLCSLWSESIDEAAIYSRAAETKCSINPQDDSAQLPILLDRLASGVENAALTAITASVEQLHLTISAILPRPLEPLRWTCRLARQSERVFAQEVTYPLLVNVHHSQTKITRLQSSLRNKDHVIARLLNRLESAGTDLTSVFPGTSGLKLSRKLSQRSQLGRHVKGLHPYESELTTPAIDLPSPDHVLEMPTVDEGAADALFGSLRAWPDQAHHLSLRHGQQTAEKTRVNESEDDTADEDFDQQTVKSTDSIKQTQLNADDPADNERRATPPPLASKTMLESNMRSPSKRIGVIGRPRPDPPIDQAKSTTSFPTTQSSVTSPSGRNASPRVKLGVIGGKSLSDSTDTQSSPESKSTGPSSASRETSQERADRRRETIKRQLAAQSGAAGAKKKRKF